MTQKLQDLASCLTRLEVTTKRGIDSNKLCFGKTGNVFQDMITFLVIRRLGRIYQETTVEPCYFRLSRDQDDSQCYATEKDIHGKMIEFKDSGDQV